MPAGNQTRVMRWFPFAFGVLWLGILGVVAYAFWHASRTYFVVFLCLLAFTGVVMAHVLSAARRARKTGVEHRAPIASGGQFGPPVEQWWDLALRQGQARIDRAAGRTPEK